MEQKDKLQILELAVAVLRHNSSLRPESDVTLQTITRMYRHLIGLVEDSDLPNPTT